MVAELPIWAIVPIKALGQAKSRLAGVLAPHDRDALVRAMARDVWEGLHGSHAFTVVLVVTPDEQIAADAMDAGCQVLAHAGELNAAYAAALALAEAEGAGLCVLLPGDAPLIDAEGMARLVQGCRKARAQHGEQMLALVGCKSGEGTNLLACVPAVPPRLAYGPGSLAAHRRQDDRPVVMLQDPALAFDIDTPDDLVALRERLDARPGGAAWVRAWLADAETRIGAPLRSAERAAA